MYSLAPRTLNIFLALPLPPFLSFLSFTLKFVECRVYTFLNFPFILQLTAFWLQAHLPCERALPKVTSDHLSAMFNDLFELWGQRHSWPSPHFWGSPFFLGHYLPPTSGTTPLCIFCWLFFCSVLKYVAVNYNPQTKLIHSNVFNGSWQNGKNIKSRVFQ